MNAMLLEATRAIEVYRGRTVLLTGARGYLGCALAQALSRLPCRLLLLDRTSTESWWDAAPVAEVVRLNGDVVQRETWERILPGVDCVFHLAAIEVFGEGYQVWPDFEVNTLSILHLLETCRVRALRPRVIYASSANLYGMAERLPVGDDAPDNPLTPWSLHKLASEHYLRIYAEQHGVSGGSLRLANVYGPVPRSECMLRVAPNRMAAAALRQGILTLYGNQACVRDYLYITDAVAAFLRAGDPSVPFRGPRHYVVGSGTPCTIRNLAEAIQRAVTLQTGKPVGLKEDLALAMGAFEMRNFAADHRGFTAASGWKPQTRLEEGLQDTLKALV